MHNIRKVSFFSWLFLLQNLVFAQQFGNSPYSQFGMGDVYNAGFARNIGMAGAGGASVNNFYINQINAAMLSYRNTVTYEFGVLGGFKNLKTGDLAQNTWDMNFGYFALALPAYTKYKNGVKRNYWVTSFGITPYSTVKYNTSSSTNFGVGDSTLSYKLSGDGTTNKFFFSNGFQITKNISLGLETGFLFGPHKNETKVSFPNQNEMVLSQRKNRTDLLLKPAIAFRKQIGGIKDTAGKYIHSGLFLGFAGTYSLFTNFTNNNIGVVQRVSNLTGGTIREDTLSNISLKGINLPQAVGFSFALDKHNSNNGMWWSSVIDFDYQQWSKYTQNGQLADSWTLKLGGEYTPIRQIDKGLLNKLTYRLGAFYGQTPFMVDNKNIIESGVTAGFAFLIPKTMAQANLNFKVGQRGNSDYLLERYFNFNFGVNINDIWFVKRRVD